MKESVYPLIGDKRGKRVGVGIDGANADLITLLSLLPDPIGFRKQPARVECDHFDRQSVREDVMCDQLVFDAKAGREDDAVLDCSNRDTEPCTKVFGAWFEKGSNCRDVRSEPGEICVGHFAILE